MVLSTVGGIYAVATNHESGPPAPRGLTAVHTAAAMVALTWTPVANADSYEVALWDRQNTTRRRIYRSVTSSVQIPGLHESTKYFIKVRGLKALSHDEIPGQYSPVTSVTTQEAKFPALIKPTGLHATNATNSSITLAWDPLIKAQGYTVQLASDKRFSNPRTISATQTTGVVGNLDADSQFYVRMRAKGPKQQLGKYSELLAVRTIVPTAEVRLRVATYNVHCHSCGGTPWSSRRSVVANTIADQGPDVIGLQEAAQSRPRGLAHSQFEDIRGLVSAAGAEYRVTQEAIGSSQGTKILFKPSTLVMLKAGSVRYAKQKHGQNQRYFAWAIFRQRSTGQRFFFASTHLQPGKDSAAVAAREAQVRQLLGSMASLNPEKYPTMLVGDFNDFQYSNFYVQPLMHRAGLIDSLGVQNRSRVPAPWATVEKRIHTNYDSFNDGLRRANVGSGNSAFNGTYLDYIFMTPMKVKAVENVINMDANGNLIGVIPSDHNMIRADVVLPY